MNIVKTNFLSPKNLIIATTLATTLTAGAVNCNINQDNKPNIEVVNNKNTTDKFISTIKSINDYDTKVLNRNGKKSKAEQKDNNETNKWFSRVIVGAITALLGGIAGGIREEKYKTFLASTKSGIITGGALGFALPGIVAGAVLTTCVSLLSAICGTWLSKGNAVIGKISAAATGILAAIKYFL